MSTDTQDGVPSRREFLKGVGAAGAGLVAGSVGGGTALAATSAAPPAAPNAPGAHFAHGGVPTSSLDFGRMFPDLPPFAEANDTVRAALLEVGMPGGMMDAGDQFSAGPKALIVDPTVNGNPTATNPYGTNPDNPTMTAGSTFVGQFTDHDITFDQTSQLGVPQNPLTSPNTRTPGLDLDSVFGGGPGLRPDLYVGNPDGSVGPKLTIGSGGVHEDVPRVPVGDGTYTALLGDPRNDENVMIAGLHCAHILFYNRVLDELSEFDLRRFPAARAADMANRYVSFLIARQVTLWHYQWLWSTSICRRSPGSRSSPTCSGTATVSTTRRPETRSCRSSSAPPPTGSGTAWSAPPTARTSPAAPATAQARPQIRSSHSY